MSKVISLIEKTFPVLVGNIETDDDVISWSIGVENPDECDELYEELFGIESRINEFGYEMMVQDDPEYFGAQLTRVA